MFNIKCVVFFNETFLYVGQSLSKPRERNDDPYPDYEDHCQNRTSFPVNGFSEQVGLFHKRYLPHGEFWTQSAPVTKSATLLIFH